VHHLAPLAVHSNACYRDDKTATTICLEASGWRVEHVWSVAIKTELAELGS
jgi:G:T-mismatch repair DNA endonuclease (very short patch repair protein)